MTQVQNHDLKRVAHKELLELFLALLFLSFVFPPVLVAGLRNVAWGMLNRAAEVATEGTPELDSVVAILHKALALSPDDTSVHRGMAWACWMGGDSSCAGLGWRKGGFTAQDFVDISMYSYYAGQYNDALQWMERLLAIAPDLESTYAYLQYLVADARLQLKEAEQHLEQAITVDHGWINEAMRCRAWFRWGHILYVGEQLGEAEDTLLQSIELCSKASSQYSDLSPILSEGYRFLGLLYWHQDDIEGALPYLKTSVEYDSQNVWAHIHYGKVLYLADQQRIAEVEAEFAKSLALKPFDQGIWENLLAFWQWANRPEQLTALCERAGLYQETAHTFCPLKP